MDRHNTKVKMAVKMLLDYLLANRNALKPITKQNDPIPDQLQSEYEKTTPSDQIQLKGLQK